MLLKFIFYKFNIIKYINCTISGFGLGHNKTLMDSTIIRQLLPAKSISYLILLSLFHTLSYGQPTGFIDQQYLGGWNQAVGMTFDNNGRMYVWEKGGRVYIVENGIKNPTPLIDISEEVGNWRDFGLLGFALDPNFLSNGHIYLLYLVDRHHLLNFGTASYDPNQNEYFNATIGRIARYTAEASTNFTTVDYSSRTILLGATKETGFPSLHESHGIGSLAFGTDGSLLVSLGDGASYSSVDQGSASETYWSQAISDGIIPSAHNVGAYRSQLMDSYAGKILRIDPSTGAGIPSNPYYQVSDPNSVQSKLWATGARNPYRMSKRPNTGSHLKEDGDPGVFYFGDVGWGRREELNIIKGPGHNFGWPKYEGMTYQPGYNNPTYAPSTHTLAAVDWRRASEDPRVAIGGTIYNLGDPGLDLFDFIGNCSTGGVWVINGNYPDEYKNVYYHSDYGDGWIHAFEFDENNDFVKAIPFADNKGSVVFLATHPIDGELYYIRYGSAIHKFSYQPSGNQPPQAVASADVYYTANSSLNVQFTGDQSSDPENGVLTYEWDFGSGPESTEANPQYTFNAPAGVPTEFTVRLTVMDNGSLIDETTLTISLNNTPPVISATSLDNIDQYTMSGPTVLNLSATVTDAEHSAGELSYQWQTALYHDNHSHPETPDANPVTTSTISPVGCDDVLYYYKITLEVTDAAGLSATYEKDIYPDCGGPVAVNDNGVFPGIGLSATVDVLANDLGEIDPTSVQIVSSPSFGNTSVNASNGIITYTRTAPATSDSFSYTVDDNSGNPSNVAGVQLDQLGPPAVAILSPADGGSTGSTNVNVTYELSGDWLDQGVDRLLVTFDGQPPYEELGTSGSFVLPGVTIGNHVLTIQLSAAGTLLTNPEAISTVNFERVSIGGGTGLQASYFNNQTLTDPATLVRIDPTINFNWGSGSPDPSIGDNNFSTRWEGQIQPVYDENYTFYTNTDDGVRLYIDGQLVIDQWIDQAPTEHTGSITLNGGQKYFIVVEYYENGGGAVAELRWSSASQPKEIVPSSQLFAPPYDQSISFDPIPDKITTDAPFDLIATATSGLPVSFNIVSGPASIAGNTLTLDGSVGTVTVRASQSGDTEYNPAPNVDQVFLVTSPVTLPTPLAHWPMEGDGVDIIGGNNGTPTNGAGFSTDSRLGSQSLSLDGVDDYFDLVGFGSGFMHDGFSTRSVTMFVKATTTSGVLNLYDEGGNGKGFALRINSGLLEGAIRSGGDATEVNTSTSYPADGAWHHVGMVFNSGTLELYVDGVLGSSQATGYSSIGNHDDPGAIGISSNVDAFGSGNGSYFNGLIDDAKLFDVALDESQMLALATESNSQVPATVTITSPQEGGSEPNDVVVNYSLSGDLTGVDRIFLTLNSDPAVELTNLSGTYTFLDVGQGNHTITAELASGSTILTNPEATDVVNFDIDPPTVVIDAPLEGATIGGSNVLVNYTITGGLPTGGHLHLTLDSDPHITIHDLSGSYTLTGVSTGAHTLTAQLVDGSHIPLGNPEATDVVNFTSTTVSLPTPLAHWPFEGDGVDVIGGNNGTPTNGAGFSTDSRLGSQSLSLDGVDDYFDLVGFGSGFMHDGFSTRTVTMFVKATTTSGVLNLYDEGGNGKGFALRINNGLLEGAIRSGGDATEVNTSTSYPADGAWHHVGMVFNSGTLELYVDGVLGSSQATGYSSIGNHSDPGGIGSSNNVDAFGVWGGSYYSGLLDDAKLFDVALDGAQMLALASESNSQAPATVTITSPQEGGSEPTDVVVNYSLSGDLTGVDRIFLTLNSDPAVELTDLSGTYTFLNVGQGNHTITAELASGSTILTNPEATDVVNFDIDPPTVVIDLPLEGATIGGSNVLVNYTLSGDLTGVDRIFLTLNSDPAVELTDLSGTYTFTGVSVGSHSITAQLGNPGLLSNPEATDVVNFTTTSVSLPTPLAHWPMEGDGVDVIGGNNGTPTNGAGFSTDSRLGSQSLSLDGVDDYFDLVGFGSGFMHDGFSTRTVTMFVKATTTSGVLNLYDEGGNGKGFALRINNGLLEGAIRSGGDATEVNTSTSYPADGAWHHVGMVFNSGTLELYVDGVLGSSQATGYSSIGNHSDPGGIGSSNNVDAFGVWGGSYYSGLLDDAKLFDVALDGAQMLALASESNSQAPATVTITSPQEGGSEPTDVVVNYSLSGDLTGVDRIFLTLNSDPAVELTDLSGTYTFLNVGQGNHTITAELASGSTILTNPEATDVVNFDIDPPTVVIDLPLEGATIGGSNVLVNYTLSGDLTGVDRIFLTLNSDPAVELTDLSGTYTFTGVSVGSHSITAQLGNPGLLSNPEATDVVNFTTTTVSLPTPLAHWPFEGDGVDIIGGNNGTPTNGATFSTDSRIGSQSLSLDGVDDYFDLVGFGSGFMHNGFSTRTVTMFVKATTTSGVLNLYDEGGNGKGFALRINNGLLEGAIRSGGNPTQVNTSTSYPADGAWHHVGMVFNSGTLELYVDGVLGSSQATGYSSIGNHDDPGAIGTSSNVDAFGVWGGSYYSGLLDDAKLFDVALDGAQMLALSNQQPPPANLDIAMNQFNFDPESNELINSISVYPNPTKDVVNVKLTMQNWEKVGISITDLVGRRLYVKKFEVNFGTSIISIDLSPLNLNNGVYIIQLDSKQLIKKYAKITVAK